VHGLEARSAIWAAIDHDDGAGPTFSFGATFLRTRESPLTQVREQRHVWIDVTNGFRFPVERETECPARERLGKRSHDSASRTFLDAARTGSPSPVAA